ncbi:MAG: hypothetical protein HY302_16330 [Opitutae bacterium]|nr:hypothetical protein [Opitutae bacterium]
MRLLRAMFSALRPATRGEGSLFLAGVNLMLLNFLMVQHAAVAIRQAEVAVIIFSLAYFLVLSLGYAVSDRLSPALLRALLPLFLGAQLLLLLALQPLQYLLAAPVARWAARHALPALLGDIAAGAVLCVLLTVCATSLYAVFLPRLTAAGAGLRRCYSVEVAGSLLGLLLVPVLAAVSHEALLAGYCAVFLALARSVGVGRWLVGATALAAAAYIAGFSAADRAIARWCYTRIYGWEVTALPFVSYTPYHKIEIASGPAQSRLLLNGRRQFATDPSRAYAYYVAEFPARLLGAPHVALLGCGSMSTVGLIGDFVPSIRIVDLDEQVFSASRTHFQAFNRLDSLRNWTFTPNDAKNFLANSAESFDLILHDIPPARSRQVALTYTEEFFRLVLARLSPGGIFSISSLTPLAGDLHYSRRLLATLGRVFPHYFVLVRHDSCYFYGGGAGLREPTGAELLAAVAPGRRHGVKFYSRAQIEALVAGEKIVTISNVGDLIYD